MRTSILVALCSAQILVAQRAKDSIATKQLNEVIVSSTRIDLPLQENARTIQIISKAAIRQSGVTTVADLLQQVAGIDIRRRGIAGMQADLYIRGGSFDQTLLLIDGVKLDDAQTGHHSMNLALPLEVMNGEIVESAARVFGQNATAGDQYCDQIIYRRSSVQPLRRVLLVNLTPNSPWFINEKRGVITRKTAEGYRYNADLPTSNFS